VCSARKSMARMTGVYILKVLRDLSVMKVCKW
jgi:hypothetical protein